MNGNEVIIYDKIIYGKYKKLYSESINVNKI